jgi:hypothetical protein
MSDVGSPKSEVGALKNTNKKVEAWTSDMPVERSLRPDLQTPVLRAVVIAVCL